MSDDVTAKETTFKRTNNLRFEKRRIRTYYPNEVNAVSYVLQQAWYGDDGSTEWRDVPTVEDPRRDVPTVSKDSRPTTTVYGDRPQAAPASSGGAFTGKVVITADVNLGIVPPDEKPSYLGDGLYARWDGYQIELSAEQPSGTQRVFLEPSVYRALVVFAERFSKFQ